MTTQTRLEAADYTHHLPDHWVTHALQSSGPFAKLHKYYVNRVVDLIVQSGARTVLEAGCGDGWTVGQMTAAGLDAVGADWSVNGINHARTMVPAARFHCGDLRDAEFTQKFPDKFDAVAMIEVIEHIPPEDCTEALENITSRLRDGGTFVLTTPHVNFPNDNPQHYRHFTADLLTKVVESVVGLKVVAVEGYGDVVMDRAYWNKMRFFDNKLFTLKPMKQRLVDSLAYTGPTSLDRCHGLILTAVKRG